MIENVYEAPSTTAKHELKLSLSDLKVILRDANVVELEDKIVSLHWTIGVSHPISLKWEE